MGTVQFATVCYSRYSTVRYSRLQWVQYSSLQSATVGTVRFATVCYSGYSTVRYSLLQWIQYSATVLQWVQGWHPIAHLNLPRSHLNLSWRFFPISLQKWCNIGEMLQVFYVQFMTLFTGRNLPQYRTFPYYLPFQLNDFLAIMSCHNVVFTQLIVYFGTCQQIAFHKQQVNTPIHPITNHKLWLYAPYYNVLHVMWCHFNDNPYT